MALKYSLKSFALYSVIYISRLIPLYLIYLFSILISYILSKFLRRDRQIALLQIKLALNTNHKSTQKIFRKSLQSMIMTVFESMRIPQILAIKYSSIQSARIKSKLTHLSCNGIENLYDIMDKGTGAVCLTGHIGNFELMAAFFSMQGIPMTVIGRKSNDPVYQDAIDKIRSEYGLNMIWRDDPENSKLLIRAIRKNHYLCALIDQDINLENRFVPFFGLDAAHPIAPIKIAVRFNKPVLMCTCRREVHKKHFINLKLIEWQNSDVVDQEKFILENYSTLLEKHIRNYPEQWVWWHRRWRRRPGIDYNTNPEKLRSSKEYINWLESKIKNK